MGFNILTVVSAVEAAFAAAEEVETEFNILKPYVTQLMNAAETAYSASTTSGASKFAAVMAATKAIASQIGVSWSSGLEATLTAFINVAKAAFNAFAGVVTAVSPNASNGVAAVTSAVSNAVSTASTALAATVTTPAPAVSPA